MIAIVPNRPCLITHKLRVSWISMKDRVTRISEATTQKQTNIIIPSDQTTIIQNGD